MSGKLSYYWKKLTGTKDFKEFSRNITCYVNPAKINRMEYYKKRGKYPNLKTPQTLGEKIQWLKLNYFPKHKVYTTCADKYAVRQYLTDKGMAEILNALIGVYDSSSEIDWDYLPDKFVLKGNHGSKYNLICTDKKMLNIDKAKKEVDYWFSDDYWKKAAELHYRPIKKKVICERFIEAADGAHLTDYQFFCFNGKPEVILITLDEFSVLYSTDWKPLDYGNFSVDYILEKPSCYDEMLDYATKLSKDFPFVRADFYNDNGKVIFSELTFTPAAGIKYKSISEEGEKIMGDMLDISSLMKR